MTSGERVRKFHTDEGSLPGSGRWIWLAEARFPRGTANRKHYSDLGLWHVISMEFLQSFNRSHFAGKPVATSSNIHSPVFIIFFTSFFLHEWRPTCIKKMTTKMRNSNKKIITNLLWPTPVEVKSKSSSRWQLFERAQIPLSLTLEQPQISRDLRT